MADRPDHAANKAVNMPRVTFQAVNFFNNVLDIVAVGPVDQHPLIAGLNRLVAVGTQNTHRRFHLIALAAHRSAPSFPKPLHAALQARYRPTPSQTSNPSTKMPKRRLPAQTYPLLWRRAVA